MSKRFFTSDLHFFHKRICEFSGRPWSEEENTEKVIKFWNFQVGPKDVVYDAGDLFFNFKRNVNHIQKAQEVLNKLNGKIVHIMGNHDYRGFWEALKAMNPDKIIGFYDNYELKIDRTKIVIDHYPGYTWNNSHHGSILLHGHEHGELDAPGRQLDIGFDGSQNKRPNGKYGFWTDKEIMHYMKDVEIFNPRNRQPR